MHPTVPQAPILSICIPTYNRSGYLKKCLDTIVLQDAFLDGRVEVIISDNASEDDTQFVGTEYADRYENIKYFRNSKNISNENFPLAISRADGIYRRLCNDTVLFKEGSLSEICQIVEDNQDTRPYIAWGDGKLKCGELCRTDFEGYVRLMSFWMTSIARFGIWASECEGIAEDIEACDKRLWQVRKGLELADGRKDVLISNQPFLDGQPVKNKNISYGLYKIFYENYFLLLQLYFDNGMLPAGTREFLEKDLLFNFFTEWCIRWEMDAENFQYSETEDLKEAIRLQYKDKDYWHEYCRQYKKRRLIMKTKAAVKGLARRK